MKKTSEPIVFFGSGPVAAESLRLLAPDFVIEAVVTKPRPPHHKGPVPVLELAETLHLKTYTVETKKELDSLFATKPVKAKLGVLVDFGIIVSQTVIDYFSLGIINSHFSLLPEWRGADPITFSILSGQRQTGVSLMLLVAKMDEGPILATTSFEIPANMTTPELTEELIRESNQALHDIIPRYIAREAKPATQEFVARSLNRSTEPTYSRKLTKEDGLIDWNKPAMELERKIRAFIEWPKSRAKLGGVDVVLTKAHVSNASGKAGDRTIIDKLPAVHCAEQTLVIDMLKPVGKQEMTGQAFLAGYRHLFLS